LTPIKEFNPAPASKKFAQFPALYTKDAKTAKLCLPIILEQAQFAFAALE
jgi:hypothetical protein